MEAVQMGFQVALQRGTVNGMLLGDGLGVGFHKSIRLSG